MDTDRAMISILRTPPPRDADANFDPSPEQCPRCSGDAAAILRIVAVAVLATACAIVLSGGSREGSNPALSASPGGGAPLSEGAIVESRCRA